ncbi:sulfatase [Candidatus Poribacteria bacterium]|nr:MAG: sulfatase [Candidatus Poribacteria bacterium]
MNVLLIALDTVRADHLSCYGYRYETSPNLDRLAGEGVLFERMYTPGIPTQPSYTTIFTGQYSITHGIVTHGGTKEINPKSPWLPSILQRHGYTTCAVSNLWRMKSWFARGFEFYIDPSHRSKYLHTVDAETINSRAIPWLEAHHKEKFFMFVHYWDAHTPYLPPPELRRKFYDGDPFDPSNESLKPLWRQPFGEWWRESWFSQLKEDDREVTDADYIRALYDAEIYYADMAVGKLLETLEKCGVADDTMVIVTSDHGELLGEHDVFFDHHGLYEGNIHTPLIFRWRAGGVTGGRRVPHFVQHVDLAPTILDAAGIPIPDSMEGKSLLPYLRGESDEPIYSRIITQECTWQAKWAIRTDEYKLIAAREPDLHNMPMRELYHLKTDPEELNNIYLERWEVAEKLEAELEGWIKRMMEKNGLSQDPLVEQGITLGRRWHRWVEEKRYW